SDDRLNNNEWNKQILLQLKNHLVYLQQQNTTPEGIRRQIMALKFKVQQIGFWESIILFLAQCEEINKLISQTPDDIYRADNLKTLIRIAIKELPRCIEIDSNVID